MTNTKCPLCEPNDEDVIFCHPKFRLIRVHSAEYPVYFRLIWAEHVKEVSDLSREDGLLLWEALGLLEKAILDGAQPDKINWAQFGNQVPHLHWHLIARWSDDVSFPDSAWSTPKRPVSQSVTENREALARECSELIGERFAQRWG